MAYILKYQRLEWHFPIFWHCFTPKWLHNAQNNNIMQNLCVCIYHICFIHSSVGGLLVHLPLPLTPLLWVCLLQASATTKAARAVSAAKYVHTTSSGHDPCPPWSPAPWSWGAAEEPSRRSSPCGATDRAHKDHACQRCGSRCCELTSGPLDWDCLRPPYLCIQRQSMLPDTSTKGTESRAQD